MTANPPPDTVEGVAAHCRTGRANFADLVEKVRCDRGCSRDHAFVTAGEVLAGKTCPIGHADAVNRAKQMGARIAASRAGVSFGDVTTLTVSQLADKIQTATGIDREAALARAGKVFHEANMHL